MRRLVLVAISVALIALSLPLLSISAQGQPVIFGIIGAPNSSTFRGVRLALEQVNQRGGVALPNGQRVGVSPAVAEARTQEEVIAAISRLEQIGVSAIFGPDSPGFAQAIANRPPGGAPLFTAATNSEVTVGIATNSFRSRAADSVRMTALADALVGTFNARRITIYQGTAVGSASAAAALVVALAQRQIAATPILQDPNQPVSAAAQVVLQSQPDTVVAFGEVSELIGLYQALRQANFSGRFVTDQADNRAFVNGLGAALCRDDRRDQLAALRSLADERSIRQSLHRGLWRGTGWHRCCSLRCRQCCPSSNFVGRRAARAALRCIADASGAAFAARHF